MHLSRPHLARLATVALAVAAIACADSLGVDDRNAAKRPTAFASLAADSVSPPPDSVPDDTIPDDSIPDDTIPPDTFPPRSAVIRGFVIGIDSAAVPPAFRPLPGTPVTLYTRRLLPDSTWAPDSIGATVTDSAGFYFFGGLQPRKYGVRAVPARGSGYRPAHVITRAVVPDSSGVPTTNIYVMKRAR
jgi:hypothetical protein